LAQKLRNHVLDERLESLWRQLAPRQRVRGIGIRGIGFESLADQQAGLAMRVAAGAREFHVGRERHVARKLFPDEVEPVVGGPHVRAAAGHREGPGRGRERGGASLLDQANVGLVINDHLDIARAWVDFYRSRLENMQDYTQRIYGARGSMWAWEFPIGPQSELLKEGTPNWFQFELHNAAYPARMARETAQYLRDPQWAVTQAWPIVREAARFSDDYDEFKALGAEVLGCSGQGAESHRSMRETGRLKYHLLCDEDRRLREAWLIPHFLRLSEGRVTVMVDPQGVVRYVHEDALDGEGHVALSLAFLRGAAAAA